MLESQRVFDEADVRPQLFFLLFLFPPLSFVNFLFVLLQLRSELLQLRVTQRLVPDVQHQARLKAALQHCQRSGKVSRCDTVAHGTSPRLS